VWTEQNDIEPEYGAWEFTLVGALEEEMKLNPPSPPPDSWPDWCEGVPTLMRRTGWCERYWKNGVSYRPRLCTDTIQLHWRSPRNLSELARDYSRLPHDTQSEWSGVYRVFVDGQPIDRLLRQDPTGTLYLGMAGHGKGNWSTLRTRIMDLANRRSHQVGDRWLFSEQLAKRFPWNSLLIQWAFTERRINYVGEETSGARAAESHLLQCYRDSFGEFPPFNEKN